MKLGKKQTVIIFLILISSSLFYYANNLIAAGGGFSEGILVGFLLGLICICSLVTIYLWGEMIYLNFKVAIKSKEIK